MEVAFLLFEMDFGDSGQVIIVAIFPFEIVELPFLIGKTVLKVGGHK